MDKHEFVYLHEYDERGEWGDVVWCEDRIDFGDIKYIRADIADARIKALNAIVQDVVDYFEADYDQPEFYERAVEALKEKE